MGPSTNFSAKSALYFMQNASCISELTFGGVCHRFPEVRFVSVESGAGWINFVLEGLDWQWENGGTHREHPEYDLLPSEYFRRQIYGCFWFERAGIRGAIERFPDNLLWETDYPHPTCMAPGPATIATRPSEYVATALAVDRRERSGARSCTTTRRRCTASAEHRRMPSTPARALRETRVLDFSSGIAGAYCSKLFADAGAEVIKVETGDGDPLRRWSASGAELAGEDGPLFQFLHFSKRAVAARTGLAGGGGGPG